MNYTIDLINSFAVRFTYRVMSIIPGITNDQLQAFLKAEVDKQNGVDQTDTDTAVPITIFGIKFKDAGSVIKTGIIIIALFVGIALYKRIKH
jgi:hypothetical protein